MPRVSPGRGGKRPGAGAPRGNMNNLKHGLYSKQFAQVGALFAQDPKVRQALLDLARKHNLKQQKANEVAALLFTRLFEHAQSIASGPARKKNVGAPPAAPDPLFPVPSSLFPGAAGNRGGNRLNLALPVDDLDSIKEVAAKTAVRQIRTALRRATKKENYTHVNQTPDTNREAQSNPKPKSAKNLRESAARIIL